MKEVFVVQNQDGMFANKHKEWVDGRDTKLLFRSPHNDEAINLVFELSSKDIYVRAAAISVKLGEDKQPIVEVTAPPPADVSTENQNGDLDTANSLIDNLDLEITDKLSENLTIEEVKETEETLPTPETNLQLEKLLTV